MNLRAPSQRALGGLAVLLLHLPGCVPINAGQETKPPAAAASSEAPAPACDRYDYPCLMEGRRAHALAQAKKARDLPNLPEALRVMLDQQIAALGQDKSESMRVMLAWTGEVNCLVERGRPRAAAEKTESMYARLRALEPPGSALVLGAVGNLALMKMGVGEADEAVPRLQQAIAEFEGAHPSDRVGVVAEQLETAYREVQLLETSSGHEEAARRAAETADRYAKLYVWIGAQSSLVRSRIMGAWTSQLATSDQKQYWTSAIAAAKRRSGRWEHGALRRDLEHAPRVDINDLSVLFDLEMEAHDVGSAMTALEQAGEGAQSEVLEYERGNQVAGSPLVEVIAQTESRALSTASTGVLPERARPLAFWLTEQRQGRVFDAMAYPRAANVKSVTDLESLQAARSARAAIFLRRTEQHAQVCSDYASQVTLLSRVSALEGAVRGPSQVGQGASAHPSFLALGGSPRADYPKGSADRFVRDVVAHLPAASRFVGYARFQVHHVDEALGARPAHDDERYAAFVVSPRGLNSVDLGEAVPIEAAVDAALQTAVAASRAMPQAGQPLDAETRRRWREVYDRVWAPVAPLVEGAEHVYVAGDGALQQVPFAALHDGSRWLYQRYGLSVVHSARDLLAAPSTLDVGGPPVVFANPVPPPDPAGTSLLAPSNFPQLDGVAAEAKDVQARLPGSVILTGADANERSLLALRHPRILHVAGHGFFLPDDAKEGALDDARGLHLVSGATERPSSFQDLDEGWMRSTLVAGVPPGGGAGPWDGFASAYEIMTMDLRGTELVTLSACQTGDGELTLRHGVTSLQRAFEIAGAESVIASLWPVSDASAKIWMEVFYKALMGGQSRAQAVTAAMDAVRTQYPDPYHWAAFALAGAIGPLRGLPTASSR